MPLFILYRAGEVGPPLSRATTLLTLVRLTDPLGVPAWVRWVHRCAWCRWRGRCRSLPPHWSSVVPPWPLACMLPRTNHSSVTTWVCKRETSPSVLVLLPARSPPANTRRSTAATPRSAWAWSWCHLLVRVGEGEMSEKGFFTLFLFFLKMLINADYCLIHN
jgi:hypothetical protein